MYKHTDIDFPSRLPFNQLLLFLPDQGVGRGLFGELLDRSIEPQKLSDALLAMLAESERRPLGEVEEVPKSHKGCITMAGPGYLEYGRRRFFQLLFKMIKLTVSWTSQDLLYVHIHVRCFHVMRLHLQQAVSVNQCSIIFCSHSMKYGLAESFILLCGKEHQIWMHLLLTLHNSCSSARAPFNLLHQFKLHREISFEWRQVSKHWRGAVLNINGGCHYYW